VPKVIDTGTALEAIGVYPPRSISDCYRLALINEQYYRVLAKRAFILDSGLAIAAILLSWFAVVVIAMEHIWIFGATFIVLLAVLIVRDWKHGNIDNFRSLAGYWTTLVGLLKRSVVDSDVVQSLVMDAEALDKTTRDKKLEKALSAQIDEYLVGSK
jgi:hypothetical protein